jgi:hypothetical protein
MLRVARQGAVKARTAAQLQARDLITTAPQQLREQILVRKTLRARLAICARFRPVDATTPVHAAKLALVQMLGDLVGRLDGWLLAEGVETENELRVLQQLGVPLAQGYFLARPAPPWVGLAPAACDLLRQRDAPRSSQAELARRLVEPCAVCAPDDTWSDGPLTLRVSTEGRPLALRLERDGQFHVRTEPELLRVKASTPLVALAERAMTRPERLRWDPIVCIDELGHLVGIVRLHRLVSALAESKSAGTLPVAVTVN